MTKTNFEALKAAENENEAAQIFRDYTVDFHLEHGKIDNEEWLKRETLTNAERVKRMLRALMGNAEAEEEAEPTKFDLKCDLKIGDKVRILDGSNIPDYTGHWGVGMNRFVGDVDTIDGIHKDSRGRYHITVEKNQYHWDARGLEKVEG